MLEVNYSQWGMCRCTFVSFVWSFIIWIFYVVNLLKKHTHCDHCDTFFSPLCIENNCDNLICLKKHTDWGKKENRNIGYWSERNSNAVYVNNCFFPTVSNMFSFVRLDTYTQPMRHEQLPITTVYLVCHNFSANIIAISFPLIILFLLAATMMICHNRARIIQIFQEAKQAETAVSYSCVQMLTHLDIVHICVSN